MNWREELKRRSFGQPEKLWLDEAEFFIESLLKQQREICADNFEKYGKELIELSGTTADALRFETIKQAVLNAPEPEGVAK